MEQNTKYIGYIKYTGKLVEGGLLDAKKSAQALLGFDEIVRHFVLKEEPLLKDIEFEIPVRIGRGSWEALIPETIGQWILAAGGIGVTAYLTAAAAEMAKKDFKNIGFKDVFRVAIKSAQWMIRIAIHLGAISKKKFLNIKWRNNNQEIGIPNEKGEYLYVPKKYLDLFNGLPGNLFSKNAFLIEEERSLAIGVYEGEKKDEVAVTFAEKNIFYMGEEEEVLFPELEHGQSVILEGIVTRGNKTSNTLGFEYKGHILNCIPVEGSVVRFKEALFLSAKITGKIDRSDKFGNPTEKKPRIIFSEIVSIEEGDKNPKLF